MSCDVTKLEYLKETKRMFREKLDPQGVQITDATPFRDYVKLATNAAPKNATISTSGAQGFVGNATFTEFQEG